MFASEEETDAINRETCRAHVATCEAVKAAVDAIVAVSTALSIYGCYSCCDVDVDGFEKPVYLFDIWVDDRVCILITIVRSQVMISGSHLVAEEIERAVRTCVPAANVYGMLRDSECLPEQ